MFKPILDTQICDFLAIKGCFGARVPLCVSPNPNNDPTAFRERKRNGREYEIFYRRLREGSVLGT